MSDDVTELRQKLAEIERKTTIWLSMLAVLLVVFLATWIASSLWMKASLEARVERAEKAAERIGKAPAEKSKTLEAERFVVRDASGKLWASFGLGGTMKSEASLGFYDPNGVERTLIGSGLLVMSVPEQRKEEKRAVSLTAGDDGPAFFLTERDGRSLFSAWVSERRRPLILASTPVTVLTGKTKTVTP